MIGKVVRNYVTYGDNVIILFEDGYLLKIEAFVSYDSPHLDTTFDYKPDKREQQELGMITTDELDELIEEEDRQDKIRKEQEEIERVEKEKKEYLRLKELYGT